MAYASAADLIARIDTQIVGDLITDDDTDTGLRERPSQATILDSTVLSTALGDASGLIDAALQNKGLYTPDQLAALTGNALSHLKRITCIVAIAMLFDRRPTGMVRRTSSSPRFLPRTTSSSCRSSRPFAFK